MRVEIRPFILTTLQILLSVSILAATTLADGPRDNNPDTVRAVPAVGIKVPDADRKELEAGLADLEALLAPLLPPQSPHLAGGFKYRNHYADVAIFHRAVRVALEDQEFFNPKEISAAKKLLQVGMDRARQLKEGKMPWLEQPGLVVLGYVSRIDGTPQPYGLVIPAAYHFAKRDRHRLDIWLHGRGETLSELNFITQRMSDARPISPVDTIVLHPYGRFCNANKFAGEIDALEALASTQVNYRVDSKRISARGFSMGGAACWQFAVHYPWHWFAATPGAGFSETPDFLKVFQHETLNPPWYEEKLWRWYDCPGYVANLKNLPVIAYSGENDNQKQAADVMEAAYKKAGMKLLHLIGPKTKHSIHPDSAKETEAQLIKAAAAVPSREVPNHLEYTTYSQIYAYGGWVTLHELQEQWEQASVTLDHEDGRNLRVTTKNVTALSLNVPKLLNRSGLPHVLIDGQKVPLPQVAFDPFRVTLVDGQWKPAEPQEPYKTRVDRKSPETCGPIDHAFMSSFIFVKPTGKCAHPAVQKWVDAEMQRAITQWRRQFRGDARVKLDSEVTDADILSSNLVLWGDAQANSLIAKLAGKLPIKWTESEIVAGDQKFDATQHALIAIYPNSQNIKKYIVLNSGFTYREYDYLNNARQTPKLPDWAIVDLRTPPNSRWPGKIVAADFFDESWKLKPPRK